MTSRPTVNLKNNTVVWMGQAAVLSPRQAELCAVFVGRFNERVPTPDLIRAVWGANEPDYAAADLKRLLHDLKAKLSEIGLFIECGRGFRHGRRMYAQSTSQGEAA